MIGGIKRIVKSPGRGGDPWDADQELKPEVEADFEFSVENTVLVSPTRVAHWYTYNYPSEVEYQRNLVRTAIGQGGKFHDHEMPLPWLRMILAGLEGRSIEPDQVWGENQTPDPMEPPKGPAPQSYYDLFPAERESPDSTPF
jgi:hypothetical protein